MPDETQSKQPSKQQMHKTILQRRVLIYLVAAPRPPRVFLFRPSSSNKSKAKYRVKGKCDGNKTKESNLKSRETSSLIHEIICAVVGHCKLFPHH
jgi:hypothetical protein